MHWGTEGEACPDPDQLSLAPQLAAAGASIIIGAHAHMLQGSGWLGHTFVAYGMGNFLWWERSYSTATGVLELTLHPHAPLTARFIPAVVSRHRPAGRAARRPGAPGRRALRQPARLHGADPPALLIRRADSYQGAKPAMTRHHRRGSYATSLWMSGSLSVRQPKFLSDACSS